MTFFFKIILLLLITKCRLCKYSKMAKTLTDIGCQSKHFTCHAKAGIAE